MFALLIISGKKVVHADLFVGDKRVVVGKWILCLLLNGVNSLKEKCLICVGFLGVLLLRKVWMVGLGNHKLGFE